VSYSLCIPTPITGPQLTDNEPTFFNLSSKSPAVPGLVDVEAGDIDNVGWSVVPPMIGTAECGKRGVLLSSVFVNDIDGACCSVALMENSMVRQRSGCWNYLRFRFSSSWVFLFSQPRPRLRLSRNQASLRGEHG
jgi:hypothetical protein